MSTRVLLRPPLVEQKEDWMCWAAVLELWLNATKGMRGLWTQETLAKRSEALKTNGDLSNQGGPEHSSNVDLFQKLLADKTLNIRMDITESASSQSAEYYYGLIRDRGYLLVMYLVAGGHAYHANLVFGADTTHGFLQTMDPGPGKGFRTRNPSELKGPLVIGYREYSMLP